MATGELITRRCDNCLSWLEDGDGNRMEFDSEEEADMEAMEQGWSEFAGAGAVICDRCMLWA